MYFEIVKSDKWHARIKAANHQILFSTQTYESRESAVHACEVVKRDAAAAEITDADD